MEVKPKWDVPESNEPLHNRCSGSFTRSGEGIGPVLPVGPASWGIRLTERFLVALSSFV
jgi:hypothetical protein